MKNEASFSIFGDIEIVISEGSLVIEVVDFRDYLSISEDRDLFSITQSLRQIQLALRRHPRAQYHPLSALRS
jgi:hypothetical protein